MILCDTGPIVAAALDGDDHHHVCVELFTGLHLAGRRLLVPGTVEDGVVCVPRDRATAVLDATRSRIAREAATRVALAGGELGLDRPGPLRPARAAGRPRGGVRPGGPVGPVTGLRGAGGGTAGVRCMLMRGGTSKGLYLLAADLPTEPARRDDMVARLMGSPDPRQINGIGGTHPLTSKVALLAPSDAPDIDVDYLFLQVTPDTGAVSAAQG